MLNRQHNQSQTIHWSNKTRSQEKRKVLKPLDVLNKGDEGYQNSDERLVVISIAF